MAHQQASYLYRGNTFFGDVEVVGGPDPIVRVHYNGERREAKLDGFPVEVVAHMLLRDLVIIDVEAAAVAPDWRRRAWMAGEGQAIAAGKERQG